MEWNRLAGTGYDKKLAVLVATESEKGMKVKVVR